MRKGIKIIKWSVLGALFVFLFGWITMLLWNWIVPDLFAGPVIDFWQALGLLILSKILLAGFGGKRGFYGGGAPYWKYRMYQKFRHMSPEEREAFKKRVRERWCGYKESPESSPDG